MLHLSNELARQTFELFAWSGEDLWNATKETNESREIMTRVTAAREGIWKDITLDVTKLLNCFY